MHHEHRDKKFIARALDLARRVAVTAVAPNPRVGAVIVKRGRIIGEGYHTRFDGPHAEIVALSRCRASPKGATLYTTLEPCCHIGKTGPCTKAILAAGIARVVCSVVDPNPVVRGKGIRQLRRHSITVDVGLEAGEAETLNEGFFYFHTTHRPFVAVKIATSLDGRIATRTGDSRWITSLPARKFARGLRGAHQAILVGAHTVLHDDPHLGTRKRAVPDPLRIILDSKLKTPSNAQVLRDKNVILAVGKYVPQRRMKELVRRGFTVWRYPRERIPLHGLLTRLCENGVTSLLVEGGGEVIGSFIAKKLVNKIYWFHAPIIIGGKAAAPSVGGKGPRYLREALRLSHVERTYVGTDLLTIGYVS